MCDLGIVKAVGGLYFFTESGNTHSEPNTFITGPQFFDVNQDTDSLAGYFHAGFKASDTIRLAFGVRYTKDEKDADALFNNFPWFLPPPDGNNTQRVFRSDDWSEFTWNASLTYSFNDNLSMYVGDAEQFSLEGQLNGTFDNWDFVGGLYFFTESGNTHSEPNTFITGPQFFDVNQDTDSLAGYFHAGFKASDTIRLAFGVRYTKDEKDADALFNNFPWFLPPPDGNNTQRVFRSDDWSEFTWNASLTYSFNDNLSMYASTAAGYQNGGYPARAFGGPQFFTAYNPTTAQNYEVGLKGLVTDNWQVALSVFFTEYDDLALQFSEPFIGGFTTVTSNAGETESKGVELESTLRFTEEWTLQTNIGFNDAEITQLDPGTIGIALGDVPTLTPE